jgi:predicted O-methyltransferase YrrM
MTEETYSHYLSSWQQYQTHAEIEFIKKCVATIPKKDKAICVNIGAGAGTSTMAVLEVDPDFFVFSIDIAAVGNEVHTNEHLRLVEAGYSGTGRVIRIWGDSKEVGIRWPMKIDYLLIDGGHERDEVRGDFDKWLRHLKKGAIVMVHDYNSRHWPEVKKAVDEIIIGDEQYDYLGLVDTLIAFKVK